MKVGTVGVVSSEEARGAAGGEGDFGVGLLNGGGGGGIRRASSSALRLWSCLLGDGASIVGFIEGFASSTSAPDACPEPSWSSIAFGASFASVVSSFAISLIVGQVSHCKNDHDDGGCL